MDFLTTLAAYSATPSRASTKKSSCDRSCCPREAACHARNSHQPSGGSESPQVSPLSEPTDGWQQSQTDSPPPSFLLPKEPSRASRIHLPLGSALSWILHTCRYDERDSYCLGEHPSVPQDWTSLTKAPGSG